jgi:hypothetical protein
MEQLHLKFQQCEDAVCREKMQGYEPATLPEAEGLATIPAGG